MSQEELGLLIGRSARAVGYYEANSRFPNEKTLLKLAEVFHVTIDYLLGRSDHREVLTFTVDQVREMAQYDIPADDPRVLEIARQLREMGLPPEELDHVIAYARFLAQQEREHPPRGGKKR